MSFHSIPLGTVDGVAAYQLLSCLGLIRVVGGDLLTTLFKASFGPILTYETYSYRYREVGFRWSP